MRLFLLGTLFFLFAAPAGLTAQRASFSGVESTYFNNSGVLRAGEQVTGYYILNYHKPEEGDGYYVLQLLDAELNTIGEKAFDNHKDITIGEVAYNGNLLAVEMINHGKERKWVELYDGRGEFIHRKSTKYSSYDGTQVAAQMKMFGLTPLVPVEGGFLYYSMYATGKSPLSRSGYRVTFISNDPEAKPWGSRSSSNSKDYEGAMHLTSNEQYAVFAVFTRPNMLAKKCDMHVVGYDLETGRRAFRYQPDDQVATRYLSGRILDDQIVLVGYNVGKSNKLFTDAPQGIDVIKLDVSGKELEKTSLSLQDDFDRFLEVKGNGKVKGMGHLMLHGIGLTEGQDMLIAAEFYKTFNGDLKVMDGLLIQLNPDLSVEDVTVVEKGSTGQLGGTLLAGGVSLAKSSTIGTIGKANGDFDFAFLEDNRDMITAAYFSGRSEVRKSKRMALYVNTLLDGDLTTEKVEFAAGTDRVMVLPAREGYLAVIEYDGDVKSLDVHLERLAR